MNNEGGSCSGSTAIPRRVFLRDVLICSLGAYGGPETHISVFLNQMVQKKGYLTEEELIELLALNGILPGPTSTQTIVSIGYKIGGRLLALLTLLVWALPVIGLMTAASFAYGVLEQRGLSTTVLRFIGPMAVGFIIYATIRIARKVVVDWLTAFLFLLSAVVTFFFRQPWTFPVVLVLGGAVTAAVNASEGMWSSPPLRPPWGFLILFGGIAVASLLLATRFDAKLLQLFESFYRYGYLVFGGGQVVVPVMQSELVEVRGYMSNGQFLTGYGLVQGLPGPMFSFAAYAGGMASRDGGPIIQVVGALIGGLGIFLPGTLLIFFVYPVWEQLKGIRAVRFAVTGVNAVAGGLIAVSIVVLGLSTGVTVVNAGIMIATAGLLLFTRIPAPIIVLTALVAGVGIPPL
ncbi:MAG: chromate efflux transporter [Spirochaetaceae bacterium]